MAMRVFVVVAVLCLGSSLLLAAAQARLGVVGAPKEVRNFANSVEIDGLANFAVDQYKAHQNANVDMSFSKVVGAKEQVVQGTMYYLTIEVVEAGAPKLYDAKVWVKPWEGFKELESFVPSSPAPKFTSADLGAKADFAHKKHEIVT